MVQHIDVPALKKQWVLDAQWTNCPPEVEVVIKGLWRAYELGNDNYMLRRTINDIIESEEDGFEVEQWIERNDANPEECWGWKTQPMSLQPLIDYLRAAGISDDEQVIIHWWW